MNVYRVLPLNHQEGVTGYEGGMEGIGWVIVQGGGDRGFT